MRMVCALIPDSCSNSLIENFPIRIFILQIKTHLLNYCFKFLFSSTVLVLINPKQRYTNSADLQPGLDWFHERKWKVFDFQKETWQSYLDGLSGLVNAPTGSGKTYSLLVPIILEFIKNQSDHKTKKNNGLQAIWITPIRALGKEIELSAKRAVEEIGRAHV